MTVADTNISVSPADALWSLIGIQSKEVKRNLYERLTMLFVKDEKEMQRLYVADTLARAFEDMRDAKASDRKEQTLDDFLSEMEV